MATPEVFARKSESYWGRCESPWGAAGACTDESEAVSRRRLRWPYHRHHHGGIRTIVRIFQHVRAADALERWPGRLPNLFFTRR